MDRRRFLQLSAVAGIAAPRLAKAADQRVLRFIPHADLTILDPTWSTAYVSRNHGYLVFDTLFGQDARFGLQPQMVETVATENDGKLWTLTLRNGLRFHDGEPVQARDVVASLRRWGGRDDLGKALFAATDELAAKDDRTVVFRLKRPFPLLPTALGKTSLMMAAIMPERIASADPEKPITEMVGSGPYRYVATERLVGDRVIYERFADYVPRQGGVPDGTTGPKVTHFDRIEWKIIPDASTAAAALQRGEIDWWELPSADLIPALAKARGTAVDTLDPSGYVGSLRLNQLHAPMNNPRIRRVILAAINQADIVQAMASNDPKLWRDGVGFFCPGTPFASDAGLGALTSRRDPAEAKRQLAAAGYKGEKVVLLRPGDLQINALMTDVVADNLAQAGFTVDVVTTDWGSMLQRRNKKESGEQGGWTAYAALNSGTDQLNPAVHALLRGDDISLNGWCHSPEIETLRKSWSESTIEANQVELARKLQLQAFADVPYVPLGQVAQLTAFRSDLTGMLKGVPAFWNIRRG